MTPGRDDDALTWSGDDDPTLDIGATSPEPGAQLEAAGEPEGEASVAADPVALPEGFEAVGRGSEAVARADAAEADAEARVPMGNATLVSLGVIGGVFLLYTIGWIIGGIRLQGQQAYLVSDVMFQGSLWLAILAPALWFGTVFLLTRGSAAWVRLVWLLAGVVLLVPWPFIMTGAVGA